MHCRPALILPIALLAACGPAETIDRATVEDRQLLSRENATINARGFAREAFGEFERVLMRSDSTIAPDCPFGDGWASGTVTRKDGLAVPVKCSTTSSGQGIMGCMTADEFAAKAYAADDGKCDAGITDMARLGG